MNMGESKPGVPNQLVKKQASVDILDSVAERLAQASSPRDVILWTQVRGELLRQNEEVKDRKQQRQLESIQLYGKLLLSMVAIVVGVLLLKWDYGVAGLFSLGVGLFWLAPDLVKAVFDKFKVRA
jgi:hypothetical protein